MRLPTYLELFDSNAAVSVEHSEVEGSEVSVEIFIHEILVYAEEMYRGALRRFPSWRG